MDGSNICESLKCQKPLEEDDVDLLRCQESFSDASLDCSVNKNNERTDIQANNKEQRDVHLETVRRDTVSKAKPKLLPLAADVYLRFSNDLRHGYRIFRELLSDQYKSIVLPFIEPVDVEAFGLKDYHERIKQPMDFWTSKLKCTSL